MAGALLPAARGCVIADQFGGTERATYEHSLSSRSRRFKAARRWPLKHDGRGGGGVCSQLQRSARSLVGLFCPGIANIPLVSAQDPVEPALPSRPLLR